MLLGPTTRLSCFSWDGIVVILVKVIRKTIIKGNNDNQMSADYS